MYMARSRPRPGASCSSVVLPANTRRQRQQEPEGLEAVAECACRALPPQTTIANRPRCRRGFALATCWRGTKRHAPQYEAAFMAPTAAAREERGMRERLNSLHRRRKLFWRRSWIRNFFGRQIRNGLFDGRFGNIGRPIRNRPRLWARRRLRRHGRHGGSLLWSQTKPFQC
ncbi:hypothetical protein EV128_103146 [Rhizobium azibense]|nr:hypothetical protein EV128_103146 [Rhizobium azibense]